MEAIGNALREARERLGFTLEEVERSTRMRKVRLEALERGDFDSLPSRVQAQGFLRNYAEFLGMDSEQILQQFAQIEGGGARGVARNSVQVDGGASSRTSENKPRRIRIYGDQIITGGAALAVIALLVWGTNRVVASINRAPEADVTEITATSAPPTPASTSTPQPVGLNQLPSQAPLELSPTLTATLPLGLVDSIEIELLADQSAFVQVRVDGRQEYQGRMQIGESLTFRGEDRIELVTGNARGVRVYFNGQDQGILGEVNQVLTRIWTIRGIQTPTPTQTLTPTASPPVPATPTETITSVARSTPGGG
ncbi:MAG: helix-turn-helix domain-containing protein [Anaerolineales bacterium]|nr:MAG: helix-turn-helix domain-containing protein [Anaerolineales bacterium]